MTAKVDFSDVPGKSVEWTNLCMPYLWAFESRSPRSILGGAAAAQAVDRFAFCAKLLTAPQIVGAIDRASRVSRPAETCRNRASG